MEPPAEGATNRPQTGGGGPGRFGIVSLANRFSTVPLLASPANEGPPCAAAAAAAP